jgi:hypothetical protein
VKGKFCVVMLVLAVVVPLLNASAKQQQSKDYQQGTVLSVDRQEVSSPNQCCYTGTDAPLQSSYYAYEVSVRVSCGVYVGRYETAFDFLPSALSPNKTVQVRLTKHLLYFDLAGEREMKMGIVHHSDDHTPPCETSSARR